MLGQLPANPWSELELLLSCDEDEDARVGSSRGSSAPSCRGEVSLSGAAVPAFGSRGLCVPLSPGGDCSGIAILMIAFDIRRRRPVRPLALHRDIFLTPTYLSFPVGQVATRGW